MCLLASTGSWVGFSLGTAIVSFFLIRHSRRYLAKPPDVIKPDGTLDVDLNRASRPVALPEDLTRWHVQVQETARDVMGELDSKMRVLQVLIRMADDASARLEAVMARASEFACETEKPQEIEH